MSLNEYFNKGDVLMVKVKHINYERLRIRLSAHYEDLKTNKDFIKSNKILERFGLQNKVNFLIDKQQDYIIKKIQENKQQFNKFTPRKINYSKMKNMPLS